MLNFEHLLGLQYLSGVIILTIQNALFYDACIVNSQIVALQFSKKLLKTFSIYLSRLNFDHILGPQYQSSAKALFLWNLHYLRMLAQLSHKLKHYSSLEKDFSTFSLYISMLNFEHLLGPQYQIEVTAFIISNLHYLRVLTQLSDKLMHCSSRKEDF